MRLGRIRFLALAAICLAVTACGGDPAPQPTATGTATAQEQTPTATATVTVTVTAEPPDPDPSESGPSSSGFGEEISITTEDEELFFKPVDVRCARSESSGRHGATDESINHLIATGEEPGSLIEVSLQEGFVLVQTDPELNVFKATHPKGMAVGSASVTFTDAELGDAVVNGSLVCASWRE